MSTSSSSLEELHTAPQIPPKHFYIIISEPMGQTTTESLTALECLPLCCLSGNQIGKKEREEEILFIEQAATAEEPFFIFFISFCSGFKSKERKKKRRKENIQLSGNWIGGNTKEATKAMKRLSFFISFFPGSRSKCQRAHHLMKMTPSSSSLG